MWKGEKYSEKEKRVHRDGTDTGTADLAVQRIISSDLSGGTAAVLLSLHPLIRSADRVQGLFHCGGSLRQSLGGI